MPSDHTNYHQPSCDLGLASGSLSEVQYPAAPQKSALPRSQPQPSLGLVSPYIGTPISTIEG